LYFKTAFHLYSAVLFRDIVFQFQKVVWLSESRVLVSRKVPNRDSSPCLEKNRGPGKPVHFGKPETRFRPHLNPGFGFVFFATLSILLLYFILDFVTINAFL